MIFDIGWISNKIFGTDGSGGAKDAGQLARAARTSKIGSRAARIVRIIRLIRLIRIVKLYKATQKDDPELEKQRQEEKDKLEKAEHAKEDEEERIRLEKLGIQSIRKENSYEDLYCEDITPPMINKYRVDEEIDENDVYKETNVGKKLSARTTKRVILLVLSIMVCIPVYSPTTYSSPYASYESGVNNLHYLIMNYTPSSFTTQNCCTSAFNASWDDYVETHEDTRIS